MRERTDVLTLRRTGRTPIRARGVRVARCHHECLDESVSVYALTDGRVAVAVITRAPGSGVRLELAHAGDAASVARWACDRAPRTAPEALDRAGMGVES